ncbi:MAG: hypothetical protein OEX01_07695 [Candidatus Bathyarchaeota archaeon]|nr:hypothetical protein [Candidatus Bathyarchaeota archaeon]
MYANITKHWSDEAYAIVYNTVKNLVSSLKQEMSKVKRLVAQEKIKPTDFNYLKYNNWK